MAVRYASRYDFVESALDKYNVIAIDTLLASIPKREPRRYLYDLISLYPARPGKGFRPGLCMATCRAFGLDHRAALRSAVVLELLHNAFLVHDDIADGSWFRRGDPTLHTEHGIGIAVNVGDAMNALALRLLMENMKTLGPVMTLHIFSEVEHMVRQSTEGQAMELGWVRDNVCDLTEGDYLRMILKKTCWYTCIHPFRIGAAIATGNSIDLDRFNRFGYYMGAAFQIQDDLLNLVGEQSRYGKEIKGDILEGKRTLALIHLLDNCSPAEYERLSQYLSLAREGRSEAETIWVFRAMKKHGTIDYARSCARNLAGAALKEFYTAFGDIPESEDKRFIQEIILYMIERDL